MEAIQYQSDNLDLTRGHKEYDSKVKNIEGILKKLEGILDISEYRKEFNEIIGEFEKDPSLSTKMLYSGMQMDYEGFVYDKYSDRLDALNYKLSVEALPFYELFLLCSRIQDKLKNVSGDNISDIIEDAKRLVDSVNELNTHNIKDKNSIIEKSYKTIYSVIMYEEIFDRSDILNYIRRINLPVNIENIGRLLSKDLSKLDKQDLIDLDLENIKEEGLGYDYLDARIIKKVSSKTVGETNSEYQSRRKQTIDELTEKVEELNRQKEASVNDLKRNKLEIKNLYKRKRILVSKMLSLVMIPIVAISAGHAIGKSASERITEYKTITRTIDAKTGRIIGEVEEEYDDHETTYVATILEQGPWRQNKGGGYVRNVTAYEYITPEDAGEDYHVTADDLNGNLIEKYKYLEATEVLGENDSTTETTLLITETYQDKSTARKSNKYTVGITVASGFAAIMIDIAVLTLQVFGYDEAKRKLYKLNEDIKEGRVEETELKMTLFELQQYANKLKEEYNDAVRKYGTLGEKFIFEEFDTKDITDFSKSLRKK